MNDNAATIIDLDADIRGSGVSKVELSKLSGCIRKNIQSQYPDATFLASPETHRTLSWATELDLDGFFWASGFYKFMPKFLANDHVPDNEVQVINNGEHVASIRTNGYRDE